MTRATSGILCASPPPVSFAFSQNRHLRFDERRRELITEIGIGEFDEDLIAVCKCGHGYRFKVTHSRKEIANIMNRYYKVDEGHVS